MSRKPCTHFPIPCLHPLSPLYRRWKGRPPSRKPCTHLGTDTLPLPDRGGPGPSTAGPTIPIGSMAEANRGHPVTTVPPTPSEGRLTGSSWTSHAIQARTTIHIRDISRPLTWPAARRHGLLTTRWLSIGRRRATPREKRGYRSSTKVLKIGLGTTTIYSTCEKYGSRFADRPPAWGFLYPKIHEKLSGQYFANFHLKRLWAS